MSAVAKSLQDGALAPRLDDRMNRLRADVMARKGSFVRDPNPFERDVALWRAHRPLLSVGQTRAAVLRELVNLAKLEIRPDWSLAGEHLSGHFFGLTQEAHKDTIDRFTEFGLTLDQIAEVRAVVDRFTKPPERLYALGETLDGGLPTSPGVFRSIGWIENHSIRDYAKVLRIGFEGIREEILETIAHCDPSSPAFARQEAFWKAALWVCDAGSALGRRHAALAREMAVAAQTDSERARLTAMAERCEQVPARGARTLHEAVQALWLAHILTCGEDTINANSIGRLDQILNPYYEADLAANRIDRDGATRLMEELACKLYLEYDVQAIVLGGVDRDSHDALNAMSWIILDATENTGFVRDLSVRLHAGSSPEWFERCAQVAARGGGIPFFFNDECFVRALSDRGIATEDARDYAPIGCIELTIPGRANPHAVSGWFNTTKCLELALFNGIDPATGERVGPQTGAFAKFASYDAFYAAYQKQVEHFAKQMVYVCNRGELAQREAGPLPCWSVLTDDCIARGRDITDGGAVYTYHSVCLLGTANTADSLHAVKTLVFDQRVVAPGELLEALRTDFDGLEPLRKRLLTVPAKYGNDVEEVDAIACQIDNHFIDLMDTFRSSMGGRYYVHLFSFLLNLEFGAATGATPDGRRAGEPLAYSLSANQGRDQHGVTAMLTSLARLPHHRAAGASAAIIDFDPKLVEGEAGSKRLAQVLRAAMKMGVGQLQFNVTTEERLRKAQEDPERYGNISVRVAGYSQMFKLLTKELQDHVIARTKHVR